MEVCLRFLGGGAMLCFCIQKSKAHIKSSETLLVFTIISSSVRNRSRADDLVVCVY